MMDAFDLASRLFGNSRAESRGDVSNSLDILTATGAGDSSDGAATVYLDADVTPADDYDGDDYAIGIPTSPNVIEGDGVLVGLTGSGPLKTPVVISNPGSGDRMQVQVDNAETLAQQAEAVAQEAAAEVEQARQDVADFRDDVATTYATKVERQDGDDAVRTFITTNYTNSNDLATTYATKTLVSQTKDAIELAASQTYETQTDAAATYATKSALTVGLDGIRTEVAEDYQPKGDYATTASMNSAIQQSASSIESSVAATYETKSDAAATYATKTEVQQTASGLDTRITTAQSTADGAYLERTATGTTIDTTGAATIRSLTIHGKSVQDGTPTPSAPVPIVSVESYQPNGCVTLVAGSTRTDIDLQGHALRSLPDGTHDEMRVDSLGRVTMTQRVGKISLSSSWWTWTNNAARGANVFYISLSGVINSSSGLCDRFELVPIAQIVNTEGKFAYGQATVNFSFPSTVTTVEGVKAWLAANPTTVLYPLATPQTIDLGTIDLPAPADTLWLDAAIVPTIGATWWTVDGIAGQQALEAEVTERQTLIRQFSGGVLAGYVGNAIAALVNAAGSFDVVRTAWTNGVPSILGTLATFGANLIRIGGEFASSGESSAKVQFFEDNSALTDLTATHYINTTTEPQVSHDLALSSTTTDEELPDGTSRTVTGNVEVWEQIYNDGTNYSDEVTVSLNGATTNRQYNASVGVDVIEASGGQVERTAFAVADNLRLTHGTGSQVTTADVPMEQAINVLSSPVTLFTGTYAQTHSAAVTLSESAANFSRLVFVCENNDGERTSVTVTDPNGKYFNVVMLTMAGPSGTGTYAYMKAKSFSINGTSVTCRTYTYNGQTIYRHGSVTLRNGVAVSATQASEEIGIVKVLGWR